MQIFGDLIYPRYAGLLKSDRTSLLIIDIQERITGVMQNHELVVQNALKLIKGFKVLGIPIYLTEQYPKGLGFTIPEISSELADITAKQKSTFSCCGAQNLFTELKNSKRNQIVIAGIECHVCVQQTALDLLANGFEVSLAADATSSRKTIDYDMAIKRMAKNGVDISTSEAILFELLEESGTEEFKAISKIVK